MSAFHVISDVPIIVRIKTKGNEGDGFVTDEVLIGGLYFGTSNCNTPINIPDSNFERLLIELSYDDIIDGGV